MLNLKALMVGFGFILAILIFLIHKIRGSIHKKKMAEMKNRRKKGKRKN